MALVFCIILFFFLLASYDVSQTSDLVERQTQRTPTVNPEPELVDIVLLASVDGQFRALNRTSGHTIWFMSSYVSSERTTPASALAPLVRTIHSDQNDEQEIYIIEPQSGDIYVMATPSSPLERFPFSMSQLVDMSPFSSTDTDNPRIFVGKKEISQLVLELETGKIKATLNSACPWDPFEELQQLEDQVDRYLDELKGSQTPASLTEVLIGRTDYHISIIPRNKSQRSPVQNLSFSTYGPNNQDNNVQASYGRTLDGRYIQSLTNGQVFSFQATNEGGQSKPLWITHSESDSPVIAVFDVLRKPSTRASSPPHTFVLLQPRPSVQDLEALSAYKTA